MPKWTAAGAPDQSGRLAVVSGASSGIGFVAARELARARATVVLAVRDTARGEDAARRMRRDVPGAELEIARLDLADLASVRAFADELSSTHGAVDLLVNSAGVMALPFRRTVDGFEMQLGTNHLGHFALTGLVLPQLLVRPEPRVVTVSSGAHRMGRINFDDLQSERRYERWTAYGQSKLANLLFAFELGRRVQTAGLALRSVAAHPGYAETNLQFVAPRTADSRVMEGLSAAWRTRSSRRARRKALCPPSTPRPCPACRAGPMRARTGPSRRGATRGLWARALGRATRRPRAGCGRYRRNSRASATTSRQVLPPRAGERPAR
jgi:NAD(P)-dependent dehydrogenase (short-subunit alcohol dehydrogenase family)